MDKLRFRHVEDYYEICVLCDRECTEIKAYQDLKDHPLRYSTSGAWGNSNSIITGVREGGIHTQKRYVCMENNCEFVIDYRKDYKHDNNKKERVTKVTQKLINKIPFTYKDGKIFTEYDRLEMECNE